MIETSGPAPGWGDIPIKLAAQIADSIEREIVERGCPIGLQLGNESQLAEAHGVSRWVMREAIAMTERDGLAEMRRGRNGGLVVSAPAGRAIAEAICNYLLFSGVDFFEMVRVRKLVEQLICELAARQTDPALIAEATAILEAGSDNDDTYEHGVAIFSAMVRLADSPFTGILGRALYAINVGLSLLQGLPQFEGEAALAIERDRLAARRRQLRRTLAGDARGAMEEVAYVALSFTDKVAAAAAPLAPNPEGARQDQLIAARIAQALRPARKAKLSTLIATRLVMHVKRHGLAPGDLIGSESEVMALFGAGRPVVREAVRVLERNGFVRMEAGRSGGLYVNQPTDASIIQRATFYLRSLGVARAEVNVLASEMAALAAELAAHKGAPDLTARADLDDLPRSELFGALAAASGDKIIQLIAGLSRAIACEAERADKSAPLDPEGGLRLLAALKTGDGVSARRIAGRLFADGAV